MPVFTGVAEKGGWDRARAVLANVSGILALVLAGLVVAGELGLWLGGTLWPGGWARARLLQFTAIMLPFMFTVCMLSLGSAALNCKGHFAYPAAAPILLNIGLIITAWWIAPAVSKVEETQFVVIAAGLVVTGIVQLAGVVWLLKRSGLAVLPRLRPVLGETRAIAAHMLPMLVPLGIIQLSAFADRLIALIFTTVPESPPLAAGVVRCLHVANRLYQLPLGVMAISIATVVFPLFSRYAARNDVAGLRETTNRALRLCIFLGLPAAVGLVILAHPIMTVIFGWRDTQFDFNLAANILQTYSLGMVAYFCNHILLRAFFSRKETSAPLRIACVLAGVNLALVIGGIFTPLRARAFGLATAVTATANTVALTVVLRRRLRRIGFGRILASLARITAAGAIMAGVV
ncbi:MAG: oligosaccharide flippase family protein, partial [Phycisphaerae bacterium]|nr:oligosaccharide flippase family protein [Phycisphaerae bacterium]